MPGISVIYHKNLDRSLISDSLNDPGQEHKRQKLFENNNFMLALSGSEGYPRQYFEDASTLIFIEGLIYNKSDSEVEGLLKAISKSYLENNDYKSQVKTFINDSDGDFIVLIYFKQLGEFIIFDDRWGRLPSYYYCDDDMWIFSRELNFILKFIPSIEFNKVSIVEFLVFEYTLGDKTLIKNIYRMYPSHMFNSKLSNGIPKIQMEKLFNVDFKEELLKTPTRNECIEKCKDLFLRSINDRVSKMRERKYNITADLSGGYDTRAVFGGLCKLNAKVDYYTERSILRDESESAEKVAALYNKKPFRIAASPNVNYSDMGKVTYITDCTVNGRTALFDYYGALERLKQVKDVSANFMGFGGEFIRHPYIYRGHHKTLPDMLKDGLFVRNIKIKYACLIMNLDEDAFFNHLTAYFNKYPEPALRDKVKHFYFEYYNNLVNAGENRHRLHFWTVQPLWSKDLLSFEMKCIPTKYIGPIFFTKFMKAVDPNLLNAPIYGKNIRLNSKVSLYTAALRYNLKNILLSYGHIYRLAFKVFDFKNKVKQSDVCKGIKKDILESYKNLNTLSPYLNEKGIHKFIENEYVDFNLYQLMTIVLYFREIENRYENKMVSNK
jgi:asparagine synthase (glutamine-hydrolysing)